MNKPFKTIYLDADGVLVDFLNPAIARVNERTGASVTVDDVRKVGYSMYLAWPGLSLSEFESMFTDSDFWAELQPYPWASALVEAARKTSDRVVVLTRAMELSISILK